MSDNKKLLLKKFLITITTLLTISFVGLLGYGILVERVVISKLDEKAGQVQLIDITQPLTSDMISIKDKKELDEGLKEIVPEQPKKQEQAQPAPVAEKTQDLPKEEEKKADTPANNTNQAPNLENKKLKIALVVTNLGINKTITEEALKLPNTITLGFSAYTTAFKDLYTKAVKDGFEVYLYLPFQPKDFPISDPGPYPILVESSLDQNISNIRNIISSFPGIKGVYGNYRESLTENKEAFEPILSFLKQNNLLLFLGRNIANDKTNFLAESGNVLSANAIIDIVPEEDAIRNSLSKLVESAYDKGYAIGYINTYPVTITALNNWLKNIDKNHIEIVPVSQLLQK